MSGLSFILRLRRSSSTLCRAGLGAITIKLSNQWLSGCCHLGNAMILLAAFLVAWANLKYGDEIKRKLDEAKVLPRWKLFVTVILTLPGGNGRGCCRW
ncbi:MAG: hypothetical protein U0528_13880 [Anaerolineae bacterium]